jgi:hypothetical protein
MLALLDHSHGDLSGEELDRLQQRIDEARRQAGAQAPKQERKR